MTDAPNAPLPPWEAAKRRMEGSLDHIKKLNGKLDGEEKHGFVLLIDTIGFKSFDNIQQYLHALFVAQIIMMQERDERQRKDTGLDRLPSVRITAFGDSVLVTQELHDNEHDWAACFVVLERIRLALGFALTKGLFIRGAFTVGEYLEVTLQDQSVVTLGDAVKEVGAWYEAAKAGVVVAGPTFERKLRGLKKLTGRAFSDNFHRMVFRGPVALKSGYSDQLTRGEIHFLNPVTMLDEVVESLDFEGNGISAGLHFLKEIDELLADGSDPRKHPHVQNTREIYQHVWDKTGAVGDPLGYYSPVIEDLKRVTKSIRDTGENE